ncbi:uncharacterized protein LOC131237086 [Magnolia sinica]|uniref:uncharacterized protein LOC131237086 n=1 Tax=Magnolia sinica TaxID=86752 RepID=UPI00265A2EF6|nr:uncharacterized protein LOC131237086 [Magnolia sinica]
MVAGFRRSLSLPKPKPTAPEKPYHVRSTSLPNRSHPSISQLRDQLQSLKSWETQADRGTSAWLCAGLNQLKHMHDSLDDLLQLPQSQESLRRGSYWVEQLLEDSLRFVDVYGIIRAALVSLKEEQLAAQVAIRRRDDSKISSFIKAQKKIQREMSKIVSVVRDIGRSDATITVSDADAELVVFVREVKAATVAVSVSVLCGVSWPSKSWKPLGSWVGLKRKAKMEDWMVREFEEAGAENLGRWREDEKRALRRLEVLEECIVGIEKESERVFRSLINARVSLLNVLTQ